MNLLRAFIAIEIPTDIRSRIEQEINALKMSIAPRSVRWVPPQNIHLTLKFLGDVSPANLPMLEQILQTEASAQSPFDMAIKNLGCFPTPRRPRIIWVGIEAPAVLEATQRAIDLSTARLGYASENRPFSPHLTIGRVAQNITAEDVQSIRDTLTNNKTGMLGSVHITDVTLFQSDLQPSGAKYTPLFRAKLGQ